MISMVPGTPPKEGSCPYQEVKCENGDLVVTVYKTSNASYCGNKLVETLKDESGLSLKAAQNWKKEEEKRNGYLAAIQENVELGSEVTLEIDQKEFSEWVDKDNSYKDRYGEVCSWILDGLSSQLQRHFKEDEIARNALHAVWTTGVISMVVGTPPKKGSCPYQVVECVDGNLVVTVYKSSNASYCGDKLVETLKDESGLSLKAAQNWKKQEEKRETFCTEMQEAAGLSCEVTIEVDRIEFSEFVDKDNSYKDRFGEVLQWILDGLVSNFKSKVSMNCGVGI